MRGGYKAPYAAVPWWGRMRLLRSHLLHLFVFQRRRLFKRHQGTKCQFFSSAILGLSTPRVSFENKAGSSAINLT